MSSIYDALNDAQVNPEDYTAEPLSAFEKKTMKREFRRRSGISRRAKTIRWTAAAACLVCLIGFSQTAYAQAAARDFLQYINLGHTAVVRLSLDEVKDSGDHSVGYDKYGKPITGKPNGPTEIYDAKGNCVGATGIEMDDVGMVEETDLSKVVSKLSVRPLLPKALPAGYAFENAGFYKSDDGKLEYINLHYTNGSSRITVQERKNDEHNVFVTVATDDTVEKTAVNGHAAVLTGGNRLEWEAGGIGIGIDAQNLSKDQLMKLAESMK